MWVLLKHVGICHCDGFTSSSSYVIYFWDEIGMESPLNRIPYATYGVIAFWFFSPLLLYLYCICFSLIAMALSHCHYSLFGLKASWTVVSVKLFEVSFEAGVSYIGCWSSEVPYWCSLEELTLRMHINIYNVHIFTPTYAFLNCTLKVCIKSNRKTSMCYANLTMSSVFNDVSSADNTFVGIEFYFCQGKSTS